MSSILCTIWFSIQAGLPFQIAKLHLIQKNAPVLFLQQLHCRQMHLHPSQEKYSGHPLKKSSLAVAQLILLPGINPFPRGLQAFRELFLPGVSALAVAVIQ